MKIIYKANRLLQKVQNKILFKVYMKRNKIESLNMNLDCAVLEKKWSFKYANCYTSSVFKTEEAELFDLSIIVPLFNSEKYIDNCLNGFIKQKTKYKFQVILIDDGSQDNTLMLAKEYQKKYPDMVMVIHQNNKGISGARNTGIRTAMSRYIAFVDHDDYVTENMVERLMSVAYGEDADIVKSAFANNVNGKRKDVQEQVDIVIDGEMKGKLLAFRSYIFPGVYKRNLFEHISFPEGYWYEDMIMRTLIYRQSCKFVHISDVLYNKYFHSNNASFVVWRLDNYKCLEQLYLVMSMIEDNRKMNLPEDVWFYQCIMRELSVLLSQRIRGVDSLTKQMAFLKACEILGNLYKEDYFNDLTEENKYWQRVFVNREYKLWLLMSGYY